MAQVWLVTGSSRGLGRAIVEASLLAGNKVLATARDTESLRELSERYGDQVKLFELDVTDESAAAGAVKTAIDAFGSLDVVINNAGYGNLSSVEDTKVKLLDIQSFPRGEHSDSILSSTGLCDGTSWTTLFWRSSPRLDSKNCANIDTASSNLLAAAG